MSYRGRGALEVKPGNSPFFVSTGSDIGVNVEKHIKWKGEANPDFQKSGRKKQEESFSFLYTRESDSIGGRVPKPMMEKPRLLTKTEFLKKWREERTDPSTIVEEEPRQARGVKLDAEQILKSFKQGTKVEDPRYTSTNNQYGFKAPTVATFVSERIPKGQGGFSDSFQGIKPMNSGLNTGLSRSSVHKSLDPQFA